MRVKSVLLLCLFSANAIGQQSPSSAAAPATATIPAQSETVIVTGTYIPVPLSENDRSVESLDARQTPLLYTAASDYLRLDPTVDLQQRAPNGVQSDLSILGSTFAETLVLLNGLRLNDAQTAHHDMDIPVPIEAISRIEVLHGAGSTFYGSDAMGGAVNFLTAPAKATEIRFLAGVGNQGFNQQHVFASFLVHDWSETLAADRDFSTGFIPDRDYRNTVASSETRFKSALGTTDVMFAGSDRPYGADQFYGDFPSWERTKNWFASAQQDLGDETSAAFGYRRHSDEFILFRDDPSIYENNHVDESWQGALRRHQPLRDNTTLSYGAEAEGDSIASNNLGDHARNREAVYGNLDFRALGHFSLSAGAREEFFSGGTSVFSPALAGGLWVKTKLKLRASVSRGFRLPTYTDLYYSDPANVGNPLLKPESAWSFDAGADWNPAGRLFGWPDFFSTLGPQPDRLRAVHSGLTLSGDEYRQFALHRRRSECKSSSGARAGDRTRIYISARRPRAVAGGRSVALCLQLSIERSGVQLDGRVAGVARRAHPRRHHATLRARRLPCVGSFRRAQKRDCASLPSTGESK